MQYVNLEDKFQFVKFEKKAVTISGAPTNSVLYVYVEFKDKVGKLLLGSTEGDCSGSRCWGQIDAPLGFFNMVLSGEAEGMVWAVDSADRTSCKIGYIPLTAKGSIALQGTHVCDSDLCLLVFGTKDFSNGKMQIGSRDTAYAHRRDGVVHQCEGVTCTFDDLSPGTIVKVEARKPLQISVNFDLEAAPCLEAGLKKGSCYPSGIAQWSPICNAKEEEEEKDIPWTIVGAVIGVVAVIAIIGVIVYLVIRHRRAAPPVQETTPETAPETASSASGVVVVNNNNNNNNNNGMAMMLAAAQQYQQAQPQYQQAPPQYQQAPPQYQQAPPQYQQAPPQYQYPPGQY